MKTLTKEQLELLKKPLPKEAVSPHPTKAYLSSIKAIYVTERFNDVFGVWVWKIQTEFVEKVAGMVVIKIIFTVAEYNIHIENYWGNDNADLWDAYKWAVTDAITKIGSFLWIWADVFKGKQKWEKDAWTPTTNWPELAWLSDENLKNLKDLINWWQKITLASVKAKYRIAKRYNDDLSELWIK